MQKWRKRETVADRPLGPAQPHYTGLTLEREAMIVAVRRHTLPPLDDCLHALQPSIPGLTRSSLHRCLQRHGISRLSDLEGDTPARRTFKVYPIGFFHVERAVVRQRAVVRHRSEDNGERGGAHGGGQAPALSEEPGSSGAGGRPSLAA